jgi:hypothetical protein
MKKVLTYFILLSIIVSHICCTQSSNKQNEENVVYEDKYTLKDYITKKFKVYELKNDTDFVSSLDSIINTVQNCYMLRNKQICYVLSIDSIDSYINIYIEAYDYNHNDILSYYADGLCFYKGYVFICCSKLLHYFFVDTNNSIERNCIKPIEQTYIYIDDRVLPLLTWRYIYENNKLSTIYISECYD